ncbi:MAG TPA: hypothetical protein VNR42_10850 [Solirubrobacteraceae bacterium]|nr:hypothetical protein [Solirubrobacteraceae bacterium]
MSTITAPKPHAASPQPCSSPRRERRLGRYVALDTGQTREIVGLQRPDGSRLVVDYHLDSLGDQRVVAHVPHDEPLENERIICQLYLADDTKGRCGALTAADLEVTHHATPATPSADAAAQSTPLQDAEGHLYRIRELAAEESMSELRWARSREPGCDETFDALTLRDVVGRLESYEPARTLTSEALARHDHGTSPSASRLRAELERLAESAILLNRGLRQAVQHRVQRGETTLSQIALRCGRAKRDARGNISGETSWLARRIGHMPESGYQKPCPWVHSDVLALIAREGLGVCPHEVEI